MTIWWLANVASYQVVGELFEVGQSTVEEIIIERFGYPSLKWDKSSNLVFASWIYAIVKTYYICYVDAT